MEKYISNITDSGFTINDIDGNIVISQMFNPSTGKDFSSVEEIKSYLDENFKQMLNQEVIIDDNFIQYITKEVVTSVSKILDDLAKSYKYDNIDSISKYLFITPDISSNTYDIQLRYKKEATLLSNYAASCWAYLEDTMNKILLKEQEFISIESLVDSIPKFINED